MINSQACTEVMGARTPTAHADKHPDASLTDATHARTHACLYTALGLPLQIVTSTGTGELPWTSSRQPCRSKTRKKMLMAKGASDGPWSCTTTYTRTHRCLHRCTCSSMHIHTRVRKHTYTRIGTQIYAQFSTHPETRACTHAITRIPIQVCNAILFEKQA